MGTTSATKHRGRKDVGPSFFTVIREYVNTSPVLSSDTKDRVIGMLRARDIKALAALDGLYDGVAVTDELLELRQIACFFKKNESLSDDKSCELAALQNFLAGERRCRVTNKRVTFFEVHPHRQDPWLASTLEKVKAELVGLFGDMDDLLSAMESDIVLTSGATSTMTRARSHARRKITPDVRVYPGMVPLATAFLKAAGVMRSDYRMIPQRDNRVAFVTKNYKTKRTIACEATHAVPFQLAIDSWLKRRLKKVFSIDLRSQRRNQYLARVGSLFGTFATLDLAMASDTLARDVVIALLPYKWARFLMRLRASEYELPNGQVGTYAKFSSMGNGLTFVLETAIFAAICRACSPDKEYSVYGDDIIVATEHATDVVRVLKYLGFSLNESKSYTSQMRFRESCGADWFEGKLITPFYVRQVPKSSRDVCTWSHLINGLATCTKSLDFVQYLANLSKTLRLVVVPHNEDTRSGVHVDVHTAYERGLLRTHKCDGKRPWVTTYRGYQATPLTRHVRSVRTYLLWWFRKKETFIHDSPLRKQETDYWQTGQSSAVVIRTTTRTTSRVFTPSQTASAAAYNFAAAYFA